jgi:hypothetical protein
VHRHTNRLPAVAGRGGLFELVFAQEIAPAVETGAKSSHFHKSLIVQGLWGGNFYGIGR